MEMNKRMEIILDGNLMQNKEMTHEYLKEMLKAPDYYGSNLDSLWDMLTTYSEPISIKLINKEKLIDYLEYYGVHLILVFEDAMDENQNITFVSED